MDKVALFNEVLKVAKPAGINRPLAVDLNQDIVADLGLDSLDTMMLTIYLGDIYGVPEEKLKDFRPKEIENADGTKSKSMTIADMYAFVETNKTTEPASFEEAVAKIK
jgi:acyl carrier protein